MTKSRFKSCNPHDFNDYDNNETLDHIESLFSLQWSDKRFNQMSSSQIALYAVNLIQLCHDENISRFNSLDEKSSKIIELQKELQEQTRRIDEQTRHINELIEIRTNAKKIYWIGSISGAFAGIFGFFVNNFYYILIGAGIFITAFVGLWEARKNGW